MPEDGDGRHPPSHSIEIDAQSKAAGLRGHSAEQTAGLLRQTDVDLGNGAMVLGIGGRIGTSNKMKCLSWTAHRREAVVAAVSTRGWPSSFRQFSRRT